MTPTRSETLSWAAVCLPLLALYGWTMPTTVTMEDAGLFLVTARFAGLAHPPGYPLYTMLAHAATWVPWGPVAVRVHCLSALFAIGACLALYRCARHLGVRRVAAVAGALAYGVSASFWSQAVVAEVYALHALFFFALLALALRLDGQLEPRVLYAFAFLYGLSLTNHWPLIGLSSVPFAVLLYPRWREGLRRAPAVLACFAAGLVPYLYLPLRSLAGPYFTAFGPVHTLGDLWWMVTRRGYAAMDTPKSSTPLDAWRFIELFFGRLVLEIGPLGFAAALIGLAVGWRALPRRVFAALVLALLSSSVLFRAVSWGRFGHVEAEQFAVIQLVPFGILALFAALSARALDRRRDRTVAFAGAVVVSAALVANWGTANRRGDTFAADWAALVLESLPRDATLFLQGGLDTGPVAYLHHVEGVRPDVALYSQNGHLFGNRVFDARHDAPGAIVAAIEDFVRDRGEVWAPFRGPALEAAKIPARSGESNGVLWRVSHEPGPAPLPPDSLALLRTLLDREAAGRYRPSWDAFRKRVFHGLCKAMVLQQQDHPVLRMRPECRLILGLIHFGNGDRGAARKLHGGLVAEVPELYFEPSQWYAIHAQLLESELTLDPALARDPARLGPLVERAWTGIRAYDRCDNVIAARLLALAAEPGVRAALRLPELAARFGHCDELRGAFEAAGVARSPAG
ncbi:MAG: DUF2723 domain-containing protein [Myxococcota bacterium]|nr:DUF2723 domain-containing protein [Myxococcota bacterium]